MSPLFASYYRHKDELRCLKESDPEFYKYLEENDVDLLNFEEDEDESALEQEISSSNNDEQQFSDEEEDVVEGKKSSQRNSVIQEVTEDMFRDTLDGALSGSINELKRIMAMFKAASQPLMHDDETEGVFPTHYKYVIPTPEMYEKVMSGTLNNLHKVLGKHLDFNSSNEKFRLENLSKHKKWKKLQMTVLIFFKIVLQNLNATGLHAAHWKVTLYFLDSMEQYIPYLSPLPRLTKTVIKVLLNIWGGPFLDEDQEKMFRTVRGHSFLRIRQLVVLLPGSIGEECLRMVYLKFARRCKSFNETSMGCILYLTNCIAELYKCDVALAYQQSFLYIRQLALHLRAAFLKKGETAMKVIRCWQFVNCLRVWTKVICTLPTSDSGLGVLCFPLSQVILGVITLLPSSYYSPLRLQLISFLQLLASHCRVFIPTGFNLCEMLDYSDLFSKPSPSTDSPPVIQYLLSFPPNSLLRTVVRDSLVNEVLYLLRVEIEIYKYNPGFPEYSFLISRKLKSFMKRVQLVKWRDISKNLVGQIHQYSNAVKNGRCESAKPPAGGIEFESLRPSNVADAAERILKLTSSRTNIGISSKKHSHISHHVSDVSEASSRNSSCSIDSRDEGNRETSEIIIDNNGDDDVEIFQW